MKFMLSLISIILTANIAIADINLKVRIFSNTTIRNIDFEVLAGKYELRDSSGKSIAIIDKNDIIQVKSFGKLMVITRNSDTLAIEKKIELHSAGFLNIMKISPKKPDIPYRIYDDDFVLETIEANSIRIINIVQLEHYVAGVIEAEAGIAKNDEFYKVQAVSTRTFALKNIDKHKDEGFNLCDQTHCQVYKGRCSKTEIMIATSKTAGQVMIDKNGELITAVFHSNSGGQTANSEDVWGKALPYLRSVNDSFSIGQRSYSWTQTMAKDEWLSYLEKAFSLPLNDVLEQKKVLSFSQPYRKTYLTEGVSLRKIREDLKLRSTFFNISTNGDIVTFSGRGFGHGVGMSQEGAIRMAKSGYTYDYILSYYYTDIQIVHLNVLNLNISNNQQP